MKINWKDFGLMFVIGIILYLLYTIIMEMLIESHFFDPLLLVSPLLVNELISKIYQLMNLFVIPAVALIFYFWRNKSDIKETIVISFVFAFIMQYLMVFIWAIEHELPISISDLLEILIWQVSDAVIITICGLIIWFVINKLKWKKS